MGCIVRVIVILYTKVIGRTSQFKINISGSSTTSLWYDALLRIFTIGKLLYNSDISYNQL